MSKTTYKIVKLLGEGSFGKAYLGVCERDGTNCVIKQIQVEGLSDQEKRETFNEASILKKLDHPNIIKFKEVFLSRKPTQSLNIVTEFADGGDLSQKIQSQKKQHFTEDEILDYFTQICLALQHMHKKKIIHRDLKSGNVFLMKSGLVKLGDFGISKGLQNTWEKAKTMVGTPYYLSPEIINSKPYDAKSDIWALGVLLYELMTFKMPFDANSLPSLNLKINKGKYKAPPSMYSEEIKDILKKCLTLDPEQRPSVNDLLKLPIITKRSCSYLNEVKFDVDLTKTMTKKYKENLIENEKKQKNEAPVNNNTITEEKPAAETTNTSAETDNKKKTTDKGKIANLFKKTKGKKENAAQKEKEKKENEGSQGNQEKKEEKEDNSSNFLKKNNGEDVKLGEKKSYQEDEIGKTLNAKGFKDLVNKDGKFDVNKMNEDQYNQLRLLKNLNKLANNDNGPDSDESESLSMSVSKTDEIVENDLEIQSQVSESASSTKEKPKQLGKDDSKEIEELKKEVVKTLGDELYKKIHEFVDKHTDKKEIRFDKEKIQQKIKEEIKDKIVDKALENLDEIFAIIMQERLSSS